jgi:peptidylprolyl isomerase/peptidyl-prolyl cis-trans isomerase B (cyclophilin B)
MRVIEAQKTFRPPNFRKRKKREEGIRMNGEEKKSNIMWQIIIPVIVALLVGSSSPWWWRELFPPQREEAKATKTTTPPATSSAKAPTTPVATPEPPKIDPETLAAVIEMQKGGKIVFEFYPKDAPNTVDNFITLAKKSFYNGLKFHRVIPGFMAQGGDPLGEGSGGPGYTIKDEFNSRKHIAGTVAMARTSEPNSAGSQFYICFEPQSHLDGQYTVFGQVIDGMDVVDKIQKGDVMKSITIVDKASLKKPSQ